MVWIFVHLYLPYSDYSFIFNHFMVMAHFMLHMSLCWLLPVICVKLLLCYLSQILIYQYYPFLDYWLRILWQALDHVIAESRRYGIRLVLCLVNNLQAYGGKTQYVKWAWEEGVGLSSSNDSFFYDPSIRRYFKKYVKVILSSYQLFWDYLLIEKVTD